MSLPIRPPSQRDATSDGVEQILPPETKGESTWIENGRELDPSNVMTVYRSYDPEFVKKTEAQLLKKIDRRILPLILIIYVFNFLDRTSITQARLYGLSIDTHLKGAEYQTAISIFSVGYIIMQIPSTLLLTKLRPSIFLVSHPRKKRFFFTRS